MPLKNVQNGKEFGQEMSENMMKFKHLVKNRLPEKVEVVMEKNIAESFEKETYQDGKSSKWKNRKNDEDPTRKLLIGKGSGKLKRSYEVTRDGTDIKAGSDLIYAQIHNEGLKGLAFGKHSFTMPKRQVVAKPGQGNAKINKEVEKWMDNEMDKIFK